MQGIHTEYMDGCWLVLSKQAVVEVEPNVKT